ncbi:MAG: NTP transferase domain-containing protein [Vicinamibacterales bacterium]
MATVSGIVLAAGRSARMGRPKAALRLGPDGPTFAAAAVAALHGGGIDRVVVVAGAHPEAVREALSGVEGVEVVEHPDWPSGQLSSLLAGLAAVDTPDVAAVAVTLVDVPLVRPATVAALVAAWRTSRAPVVRPAIGERHGHPVIFDRAAFAALRAAPPEVGAKAVIAAFRAAVVDLPVDDPGALRDVDTPAEYDALLAGDLTDQAR